MSPRILILGNSGSGKSTMARALAQDHGIVHLDLDTIVWVPGEIAVPQAPEAITAALARFRAEHPGWVIEGCYGEWIEPLLPYCTELRFLDPGVDACLANNRRRPHEAHKYATMAEQQQMFEALQDWVAGYETRDDAWSRAGHQRVFDQFQGSKRLFR